MRYTEKVGVIEVYKPKLNPRDCTSRKTLRGVENLEIIEKRNALLIELGEKMIANGTIGNVDVTNFVPSMKNRYKIDMSIRLIGNPNQPTMIFNISDEIYFIASIFVKNFKVFFSDDFADGNIYGDIDLNNYESIQLPTLISVLNTKEIHTIDVGGLKFSRFDIFGHAFFSKSNPRFYFNDENIQRDLDLLLDVGFENAKFSTTLNEVGRLKI